MGRGSMEAKEKRAVWVGFAPTSENLGHHRTRMGHIADPAGAVVVGCKVLPIFNEHGIVDGAMKVVHRIDGKKAVTRVKELLKWAAQARPHRATIHGKKWKVTTGSESFLFADQAQINSAILHPLIYGAYMYVI
jgi:hypothetical protein